MHPGVHYIDSIKVAHYSQIKKATTGCLFYLGIGTGLEPILMGQSGGLPLAAGGTAATP